MARQRWCRLYAACHSFGSLPPLRSIGVNWMYTRHTYLSWYGWKTSTISSAKIIKFRLYLAEPLFGRIVLLYASIWNCIISTVENSRRSRMTHSARGVDAAATCLRRQRLSSSSGLGWPRKILVNVISGHKESTSLLLPPFFPLSYARPVLWNPARRIESLWLSAQTHQLDRCPVSMKG